MKLPHGSSLKRVFTWIPSKREESRAFKSTLPETQPNLLTAAWAAAFELRISANIPQLFTESQGSPKNPQPSLGWNSPTFTSSQKGQTTKQHSKAQIFGLPPDPRRPQNNPKQTRGQARCYIQCFLSNFADSRGVTRHSIVDLEFREHTGERTCM